jgi:hypothetical protein
VTRRLYTTADSLIDSIISGPRNIRAVVDRVAQLPGFGPWSAFKAADMIDGCLRIDIVQDDLSVFLYDTPRKSILESARRGEFNAVSSSEDELCSSAMGWLADELAREGCTIPHKRGKPPDLLSIETVWCKHKSHLDGHYPLYKDCIEIAEGMRPWMEHTNRSDGFFAAIPRPPEELTDIAIPI